MALTKEKKQEVVDEFSALLDGSKMTVLATYQGTPVKSMQQLRRDARANGTTIKVVKNRLVIKALENSEKFKDNGTEPIKGATTLCL